jgi:hypothetical protein
MRLIKAKSILEEYDTLFKSKYGTTCTVFKNPSQKEFQEVDDGKHGIRFSADNTTKTLYIWGGIAATHYDVRKHLGLTCKPGYFAGKYVCGHILDGWAEKVGSTYEMYGNTVIVGLHDLRAAIEAGDYEEINYGKEILAQNWSWVGRYIKVDDHLNHLRKETGWGDIK